MLNTEYWVNNITVLRDHCIFRTDQLGMIGCVGCPYINECSILSTLDPDDINSLHVVMLSVWDDEYILKLSKKLSEE